MMEVPNPMLYVGTALMCLSPLKEKIYGLLENSKPKIGQSICPPTAF